MPEAGTAVPASPANALGKLADALGTGDPAVIERCTEALLAPGVTWLGSNGGYCSSDDEVVAVLRTQLDEGLTLRLVELHPLGDQALLCLELRPPAGVRRAVVPWRVLLTFDADGRIAHMQDYADADTARRDMALRARGPEPGTAAGAVTGLVPFVHVADVQASAAFYALLGFAVQETYRPHGRLNWASLAAGEARLMLALADEPVVPEEQSVLFYLHSPDLAGLREELIANGVRAGEIVDGTPGPRAEMRLTDPDGYTLMVAQLEP